MRMLATKYNGKANPMLAKKAWRAEVEHVAAPLKGLSLANRYAAGDPYTAIILRNFTVEDDRIQVRAGYKKQATRGTAAIWHLVPYYGAPQALLAASNNELWDAATGNLGKGGFTSNDWQWSAFSNLSEQEFTVMVNGADGVWSWNGGMVADGAPLAVTAISKANPAVCTVSSTASLTELMNVAIAGATGGFAICNGNHSIHIVDATNFSLPLVDTSAVTGTVNAGVTATPLGSFVKENITVKPADTFINPNNFNLVIAHQNRLFFADKSNLAVYYLPLQQKSGQVSYLPLNVIFKRGGYIKAMYSWTIGGATNMDNQLVMFSSNGECAIYGGTDPDNNFQRSVLYRFDAPMSKHSVVDYGGELY